MLVRSTNNRQDHHGFVGVPHQQIRNFGKGFGSMMRQMGKLLRSLVMGGALLCLSCVSLYASMSDNVMCKIEEVSNSIGVTVVANLSATDSWGSVSYDPGTGEQELLRYLDLLQSEFSKYPEGYLQQSQALTIILGSDLNFCGQPRAAIPDPYKKQLFLSVNGAFRINSERYLAHVMHHELHHLTEYSMWKNMTFDWHEWILLNGDGFCYGTGGADAYSEYMAKGTDFYSPNNPHQGFINLYSLTGDEEDRAELMAFIMTDYERPMVEELLQKDAILRQKSRLLARLLQDFSRPSVQLLGRISTE